MHNPLTDGAPGQTGDAAPATTGRPHEVTEAAIAALPQPVQRYLRFARVIGRPVPATVRLRQRGAMRLRPGARWHPFEARQVYTTDSPGFVWRASLKLLGFWPVKARDSFADGHGRMEIWPAPLVKAVDVRGPELDQGELLRFLGELPWYPATAVLPYLRWEAIDDGSARATITAGGVRASAVFRMAPSGAVTVVSAERPWTGGKGPARLVPWSGRHADYREIAGMMIPTRCLVTWHLPEGDYGYFRARIARLVFESAHAGE